MHLTVTRGSLNSTWFEGFYCFDSRMYRKSWDCDLLVGKARFWTDFLSTNTGSIWKMKAKKMLGTVQQKQKAMSNTRCTLRQKHCHMRNCPGLCHLVTVGIRVQIVSWGDSQPLLEPALWGIDQPRLHLNWSVKLNSAGAAWPSREAAQVVMAAKQGRTLAFCQGTCYGSRDQEAYLADEFWEWASNVVVNFK